MKRLISMIAVAIVATMALSACGNNNTASSGKTFNDADVTFAQSMIPHHQQAVEMARMAQSKASSAEVKALADKIAAAQGPEIDVMTGWLKDWGKSTSSPSNMSGMDMGSMPGMMSDAEMKKLDASTGAQFDRMFLTMMIAHHNGAIEMAKTEQSAGKDQKAVKLARSIESAQSAEIATMRGLLTS